MPFPCHVNRLVRLDLALHQHDLQLATRTINDHPHHDQHRGSSAWRSYCVRQAVLRSLTR
eukprot:2431658-Amphidinium_carterae.3